MKERSGMTGSVIEGAEQLLRKSGMIRVESVGRCGM